VILIGYVQNNNAERAIEWLFNHPDDDGTMDTTSSWSATESTAPDVGGTKSAPVTYRLKAFISHKGPSVHSGHYVAHIRDVEVNNGGWVLFNDEKVVKADDTSVDELKKGAYLYFFEKI
jgi:ubiquitin carboxyl-terminal hydrolase 5/13